MSHRGAKQSPFVGKRVPLVDNGVPILYQRYTAVGEIVVGGASAQPATVADAAGWVTKKEKKKARKQEEAALAPTEAAEPPAKKVKLAEKPTSQNGSGAAKTPAAANVTADGNDPASIAARREARQKEKKEKRQQRREREAAEAAVAALRKQQEEEEQKRRQQQEALQKKRGRGEEDSTDSDSSSSDSDSDSEMEPAPAPAPAAPAASSDSETSSSDSDSEESSDRPAVTPAARPAAAGTSDSSSDDSSDESSDEEGGKEAAGPSHAAAAGGGQAGEEDAGGAAPAGNAEEAGKIRSVMGFSSMSSKAAPSFKFGFSVAEQKAQEAEEKLKWIQTVDSVKDGFIPRRIYAGGMPFSWEEEQIREYWEFCGEVESIDMLRFPDSGRFRGLAFITFKTEEGLEAALQYDGEQCERGALKVMRCKPSMVRPSQNKSTPGAQQQQQQQQAGGQQWGRTRTGMDNKPQKVPGFNVAYVGNIAFETSLEELQELFQPYAAKFIRMHTDKATGRFKGYAHVHFEDEDGLDRSMELDGNRLHGREMRVSYAQPKKNAPKGQS